MTKPVCLISGVGPGTGSALARRFSQGGQAAFNKDGARPADFFIEPEAIAEEAWHIAHQPRGAWSFNVEVRPHGEVW